MRKLLPGSIFLVVLLSTFESTAHARPARPAQIPNGNRFGCLTCHTSSSGGPRNPFGTTIESGFLSVPGAAGVVQWGPALAALNSDGDGAHNGLELNDPLGQWTIGQPNPGDPLAVRNPGVADVVSAVPAASDNAVIMLTVGLLGMLVARARKRARAAR